MRDSTHAGAPHRINSHSVAMTLETLRMEGVCGVNGSRTRCSSNASHCGHRSGADSSQGAVWSNARLQSLGCTFPWTASAILRWPLAWPLTTKASGMTVTTWLDDMVGVRMLHLTLRQETRHKVATLARPAPAAWPRSWKAWKRSSAT